MTIADVDLVRNLLVIRGTKFGKSRFVPFGPQMADLRDRTIRLVRTGLELMRGGYLNLLRYPRRRRR